MNSTALQNLQGPALRLLAGALKEGALAGGISGRALKQIAGPYSEDVESLLRKLTANGMSPAQIAVVVDAIADTKDRSVDAAALMDLVLSGPEVAGIPTNDTSAVMRALVESAQTEILLVGYAVHNGQRLFARLAERMSECPQLKVVFCLDVSRAWQDTSLSSEIVRRFAHDFKTKHWPWQQCPAIYYDPRSLEPGHDERSSLHAKCVVVDRREALITSANFTEAAQQRNIEVGVRVRYGPLVERLATYFHGLIDTGQLIQIATR